MGSLLSENVDQANIGDDDRRHPYAGGQKISLRDQIRIMVVDDMSTSRALITQALERLSVRNYTTSNDGMSAWHELSVRPVHLVISDYNMPGLDGLGLLQKLRQNPATQNIGFIMITGRAEKEIILRGQQLGMNNYLPKPFSPEQLQGCIEAVVGRL